MDYPTIKSNINGTCSLYICYIDLLKYLCLLEFAGYVCFVYGSALKADNLDNLNPRALAPPKKVRDLEPSFSICVAANGRVRQKEKSVIVVEVGSS